MNNNLYLTILPQKKTITLTSWNTGFHFVPFSLLVKIETLFALSTGVASVIAMLMHMSLNISSI